MQKVIDLAVFLCVSEVTFKSEYQCKIIKNRYRFGKKCGGLQGENGIFPTLPSISLCLLPISTN